MGPSAAAAGKLTSSLFCQSTQIAAITKQTVETEEDVGNGE